MSEQEIELTKQVRKLKKEIKSLHRTIEELVGYLKTEFKKTPSSSRFVRAVYHRADGTEKEVVFQTPDSEKTL